MLIRRRWTFAKGFFFFFTVITCLSWIHFYKEKKHSKNETYGLLSSVEDHSLHSTHWNFSRVTISTKDNNYYYSSSNVSQINFNSDDDYPIIENNTYISTDEDTLLSKIKKNEIGDSRFFDYVILEKNICNSEKELQALIFVHSSASHFRERKIIRETWGNSLLYPQINIKVVFILGKPENSDFQNIIEFESKRYHDIIQKNFTDSYRNLTYKAVSGLKWVIQHCHQAEFVIKTDDDILINIFNLEKYLHRFRTRIKRTNWIACLVWTRMPVFRDIKNKWFVSEKEFSEDVFPPYCSGSAYIMSAKIVPELVRVYLESSFFWIDDIYITGILAAKANATLYQIRSAYDLSSNEKQIKNSLVNNRGVFAHLPFFSKVYYNLWIMIYNKYSNNTSN